jgi:hypothetical protein
LMEAQVPNVPLWVQRRHLMLARNAVIFLPTALISLLEFIFCDGPKSVLWLPHKTI